MQLRGDGLIEFEKGRCTILNHEKLEYAGMFEPSYLHLKNMEQAAA
jgi:hypothetical protein